MGEPQGNPGAGGPPAGNFSLQHAADPTNGLEELEEELLAWLDTPDWATSQTYLQEHSRLLTEQVEQMLEQLAHVQTAEPIRRLISHHHKLLHEARQWGIANVYAYFLLAEQAAGLSVPEGEALLQQVRAWLVTADWEQSQAYLETHPNLMTPAAEAILATLWLNQQTSEGQVMLAQHLQFLQQAQAYGIIAAYRTIPSPSSLDNAGFAAWQLYQASGDVEPLLEALDCWQRALMLLPPNSPNRPTRLIDLGIGLLARYEHTGTLRDLGLRLLSISKGWISPQRTLRFNRCI